MVQFGFLSAYDLLDLYMYSGFPSLGDVEKLQKLWQLQNLDTQAADIMKSFWFGTNLGELT